MSEGCSHSTVHVRCIVLTRLMVVLDGCTVSLQIVQLRCWSLKKNRLNRSLPSHQSCNWFSLWGSADPWVTQENRYGNRAGGPARAPWRVSHSKCHQWETCWVTLWNNFWNFHDDGNTVHEAMWQMDCDNRRVHLQPWFGCGDQIIIIISFPLQKQMN